MSLDRPVRFLGLVLALAAAVGAIQVDNDLESTLFMAAAVICSLATFDVSLDRHTAAFWPWSLVSTAILSMTIPSVVGRLLSQEGPAAERTLHLGSVLFGLCLAAALGLIVRPRPGGRHRGRLLALIALAALAAGFGASAATFAGRDGLGSVRAARLFETLGWAAAGAIVMGAVLAATLFRRPAAPMLLLGVGSLAGAVMVARVASGYHDDLGWWGVVFVTLASGALLFSPAGLGTVHGRQRTLGPAVAGVMGGVLGAQAGVLALRGVGASPEAIATLVVSLALAAVGLSLHRGAGGPDLADARLAGTKPAKVASDPVAESPDGVDLPDPIAAPSVESSPRPPTPAPVSGSAFSRALATPPPAPPRPGPPSEPAAPPGPSTPSWSPPPQPAPAGRGAPSSSPSRSAPSPASRPAPTPPAAAPPPPPAAPAPPAPPVPAPAPPPAASRPAPAPPPAAPAPPAHSPARQPAVAPPPSPATPAPASAGRSPSAPAPGREPSPVAGSLPSPQPVTQRASVPRASSLAPHLVDPQTNLQSAAGLQEGLSPAFSRPRVAGEVTILMVALGGLPSVEARYGRIVARQVVAELARRFAQHMPDARVARFSTDGFAALLDGPALAPEPLVDRCTSVLIDLLDPVQVGTADIEIEVAAGMAQCYENEGMTSFLTRANQGLAQAVASGEPTLIAMP